jgi:N12 class adenine-specific DNA methylase
MTPAEMVEMYIKLRDHKKAAEKAFKESLERTEQGMEKLEGMMLKHLDDTGANNIACDAGTVYRNMQLNVTVEDKQEFLNWLQQSGEWEALDLKANKTYVRQAMEDGDLVPGVRHSSIFTVGVRRSS